MNKITLLFKHEEIKRLQNAYKLNTGDKHRKLDKVFIKLTNKKAYMMMTNGYQGLKFDITENVQKYGEIDENLLNKEFTISLPTIKTKKKTDFTQITITNENANADFLIDSSHFTELLNIGDFQFFDKLNDLLNYNEEEYSSVYVDIDKLIQVLQGLKNNSNKVLKISVHKTNKLQPLLFSINNTDKALLLPVRMPD